MARRRLYVLSCVDPFGRPFGGSLDVMERLKWAARSFDTVIVFCPGAANLISTRRVEGRKVIAVYGRKRLNIFLALMVSLAVAWKPVFRLSPRRLRDNRSVFLVEGFLSICMLPQLLQGRHWMQRRKIRVHNDEALFHLDRAETEASLALRWVLRLEAARLWVLERLFYSTADFDRCYISRAEARRFGMRDGDVVIPYLPEGPAVQHGTREKRIVTVANFTLVDNRRAIADFLDAYLAPLAARGFTVVIAGYGSQALESAYRGESAVRILGAVSEEDERRLYQSAMCCLVASNNRAGYKTRISTALAHGLVPVLHGRGAMANAEDAALYVFAHDLVEMIDGGALLRLQGLLADGQYLAGLRPAVTRYHQFLDCPTPRATSA